MNTVQLIYASEVAGTLTLDTVAAILNRATTHNAAKKISGFLCFDRKHFLQVLEGDTDSVNQLYHRIAQDRRHKNLTLISFGEIPAREFPEWSMGDFDLEGLAESPMLRHHIMGSFRPHLMDRQQALALLHDLNQIRISRDQPHGI